ncbi:hypothetical protein KDA_40660 [Dictyobacter alpinus]|uniref:DNA-directed RNA polymerase sigma-70 factor n=1 Tax=Dictyobacter alpinus TaxID=2014873 RepID=A0A402BBB1_9CHLR|nr:sigma-70 family RNA polymerase sigma factor [Dictyobacter alpinus]GCE28582.1 hypothetical protein KDA_40660 [Dictyobacter alpinus]
MHQPRDTQTTGASTDVLFERYGGKIFTYLRQHTHLREDAEDILLDIFTAAMEDTRFATLPEQAQVAWLWRVARNKTIDAFRKGSIRNNVPLEHVADTIYMNEIHGPEGAALRLDNVAQIKQLLADLSPAQQEVLWLRFGYELNSPEIAIIIGKSETAVRAMLSRTMNFLRQSQHIRGKGE